MHIAILSLSLTEAYDAVCFDVLYQYRFLSQCVGVSSVGLFASSANPTAHEGVTVGDTDSFYSWCSKYPDGIVIFHYCDSSNPFDEFLRNLKRRVIVRWHNNTPPWFNLDSNGQAIHSQVGYENLVSYIENPNVFFWVNSNFTERQLKALGCEAHRIDVIYPGSRFLDNNAPVTPKLSALETKSGYDLLFVGRTVPHKGHVNAVATANALRNLTGLPVRMHFVGKRDPGMTRFNIRIEESISTATADVLFLGQVDSNELVRLYSTCDAFLCLSEHEGFGLPIFEAVRCGLPVVAWATSAVTELLEGHPFAFNFFDPNLFAAAIRSLAEPQAREFVLTAQQKLAVQYTHAVVSSQIQAALTRLHHRSDNRALLSEGLCASDCDPAISQALSVHYTSAARQFRTRESGFDHDSGANLVSLLDLAHYRRYFERKRTSRFAALATLSERFVHIAPIEQSFKHGTLSGDHICWGRGANEGFLLWGPYLELSPGAYVATFRVHSTDGDGRTAIAFDVNCRKGVLAERTIPLSRLPTGGSVELPFTVEEGAQWLEFRVAAKGELDSALVFQGITLRNKNIKHVQPRRVFARDISWFPARSGSKMSHLGAIDDTSLPVGIKKGVFAYSERVRLGPGEYGIDLQLAFNGEADARVTCKIEQGGSTLATETFMTSALARRQPCRLDFNVSSEGTVELALATEGVDGASLEYIGAYLFARGNQRPFTLANRLIPAFVWRMRARRSMREKSHEDAANFYIRFIEGDRATADDWIQYAHALKEIGDLLGAEIAYHRALRLVPIDTETKLHLAHLYLKMERYSKARYFFEELLAVKKFQSEAEVNMRRIASLERNSRLASTA